MQLEPLMDIEVDVDDPIDAGQTPTGGLRVIPFRGGRFSGPDLRGRLLPGGTDWQRVRADGVIEIRARYLLETDEGERIEVVSEGIRHAAPGVLDRLMAGETVPPEQYYFRTFIRLATAAERLAHLNRLLAIATGERSRHGVAVRVFGVR